jgi:hypothetical protein
LAPHLGTLGKDGKGLDASKVLQILRTLESGGTAPNEGAAPLGPVNGALGQTIGRLLNGRKSLLGILGAVATGLIGAAPAGGALDLAKIVPMLAGTNGYFLPVFLGLAAWGALGKMEKLAARPPVA